VVVSGTSIAAPVKVFTLSNNLTNLADMVLNAVTDRLCPIGKLWLTEDETNPATFLPGTRWEQVKDKFLLAAGDIYAAGSEGGEAEHTLTVDEMPRHKHGIKSSANSGNTKQWAYTRAEQEYAQYFEDTQYSGGGLPHNNMPPYLAVYIWKRVA
jgi:hypothetical protein